MRASASPPQFPPWKIAARSPSKAKVVGRMRPTACNHEGKTSTGKYAPLTRPIANVTAPVRTSPLFMTRTTAPKKTPMLASAAPDAMRMVVKPTQSAFAKLTPNMRALSNR
jgi:hypothetical protein